MRNMRNMSVRMLAKRKTNTVGMQAAARQVLGFLTLAFTMQAAIANGLLWRADGSNGTAVLLGSVHAGSQEMYPLSDIAELGFAAADRLLVEADVTQVSEAEMAGPMQAYGMFPQGSTLEAAIGPELWARTATAMEGVGVVPAMSAQFRPWLAAVTLGMAQVMQSGYSELLGVDIHFLQRAHEQGKPIIELETVQQQLGAFAEIPASEQAFMLQQSLDDYAMGKPLVDEMFSAWMSGDERAINTTMNEKILADGKGEVAFEKLIVNRNRGMTARILEELDKGGDLFVVVGAAHLVGKHSIVSLLEESGVKVARLR